MLCCNTLLKIDESIARLKATGLSDVTVREDDGFLMVLGKDKMHKITYAAICKECGGTSDVCNLTPNVKFEKILMIRDVKSRVQHLLACAKSINE